MRRTFAISIACCLASHGACAAPPPTVPRVAPSNLAMKLTDFVRIPASGQNEQPARTNYLFHAGDGSGRLFVNDMRGRIYVIHNGLVLTTPFLDIAAARSAHFVAGGGANREVGALTFAFHPRFNRKGA